MKKPILCLDFDGVIHSYTSGWKGADNIPDEPVSGFFEFLESVCPHFEVHIFSSRSSQPGGIDAMIGWVIEHRKKWRDETEAGSKASVNVSLSFPTEKPPAMVTIDDRAITFTGTWPDIDELKAFKPWNKP